MYFLNKKKFILAKIASIIGVVALLMLVTFNIYAQKSKEKLQSDKKKIESEIAETNKLLKETKKKKQVSLNQIMILNNKINQRQKLINTINSEILTLESKITTNCKETSQLTEKQKQLKEEYAKMIVYAYKNRNASSRLMFLFASSNVNQAYLRLKYLQQYNAYRKKQAELITNTSKKLNENISQLKNIQTDKTVKLKKSEDEELLLAKEKEEKNNAVKKLLQKEKELKIAIKQKQTEAKKLQQSIETIITAEINKAAAAKSKTTVTTKTNVKVSLTSKELGLSEAEIKLSDNFSTNKGKLPWPTDKGIVVSTFGVHPHPVLSDIKIKNNGIDISASKGDKARAVFDGKVTGVVSIPGAGKAVIVRHGEYLTVYSNLSEVYVKTGDTVKTKQNIGLINTDEEENKTEMHFEIWFGKVLTDPENWLLPN